MPLTVLGPRPAKNSRISSRIMVIMVAEPGSLGIARSVELCQDHGWASISVAVSWKVSVYGGFWVLMDYFKGLRVAFLKRWGFASDWL